MPASILRRARPQLYAARCRLIKPNPYGAGLPAVRILASSDFAEIEIYGRLFFSPVNIFARSRRRPLFVITIAC